MRNLVFISNLLPRPTEPQRGMFNAFLLQAVHRLLQAEGGCLRVLIPVAAGLHKHTDVAGWRYPGAPVADDVCYVPYLHIPYVGRNLAALFCRRALRQHIKWFQESDVVVGSWLHPDAVAAASLARLAGTRFVARLHGTDRFHLQAVWRGKTCRETLARADRILVNAVFMRDALKKAGFAGVRVIENGVDATLFHPGEWASREPGLVLWVGNLVEIKDPARAIRVFQESMQHGARKLVLVGAGPLQQALERQIQAAGLGASVSFAGRLQPGVLGDLMRKASCLLLTSASEGMPNVVQEALACGTPVVSTRVGDVARVVRDGVNGFCGATIPTTDEELIGGMRGVLQRAWDPHVVRDASMVRGWEETARAFLESVFG